MINENKMKILVLFFPKLSSLTSKEIEEKSNLSHETIFRLLKGLVKKRYLLEKQIGKTNLYEIIKDGDLTYPIFIDYMFNKKLIFKQKHLLLYKRIYEFIKEINPDGPSVIFGSYAKGTETKNSDVDILCVTNKKNIQNTVQAFKIKYNLNIQFIAVKT